MAYSFVLLPREFVVLLQSNMQTSGAGYSLLKREYWNTPSFQAILARTCRDIDPNLGFEKIITSLGWLGLRDRIAASYLGHQELGVFPNSPDIKVCQDILQLEDQLKGKTVDGYSRTFLFGLYKKMLNIRLIKKHQRNTHQVAKTEVSSLLRPEVVSILSLVQTRTAYIDWLCVALEGLLKYEGEDRITQIIKAGGGLAALQKGLKTGQREDLTRDLLVYGASIGHSEAFVNPTV